MHTQSSKKCPLTVTAMYGQPAETRTNTRPLQSAKVQNVLDNTELECIAIQVVVPEVSDHNITVSGH